MRAGGLQNCFVARAFAALAACALGACAAGSSYMGIPLDRPVAPGPDAPLQNLAARAEAGDKRAQLELGIMFEEGRGVPRDLEKAKLLYLSAASSSSGMSSVYVPKAGPDRATILHLSDGSRSPGLDEARVRLARLMSSTSVD